MLRAVKPNKTKARRVLVMEHLVILHPLHVLFLFAENESGCSSGFYFETSQPATYDVRLVLLCISKAMQKIHKKRTDIMRQHMVRNKNKSSFTCSQPTSSKFMVPAAPHTAVQFALCSEPLNPTRQKLGGYW